MNNRLIILKSYFIFILLFSSLLFANTNKNTKDFNKIQSIQEINQIKYVESLKKIESNAESLVLLLISEMALQKGDVQFALYGYTSLLEKTNDANVAKRNEEIALYAGAYSLANEIHKKWKQIEPVPSFNQKLIEWQKNIIFNTNINQIINDLPYIIDNANENEQKKCFIYISELALRDKNVSSLGYKIINTYANKYNTYPESAIADLIFSANSNHKRQAQNALKKLTKKDPTLIPNLALYLNLVSNYLHETFDNYFKKISLIEAIQLNDFWTTLYIESLLRTKQIDKAYQIVLQQLDQEPSFEKYFQAGYISSFKNKNPEETDNYFEKAYSLANKNQKDRITLFAAISLINLGNNNLTNKWINKIDVTKFPFDKNFLIALYAFNNKNWGLVNQTLQKLNKSKIKRGIYYSKSDVLKLSILTLTTSLPAQESLEKINNSIDYYNNKIHQTNNYKDQKILIEYLSNLIYQRAILLASKFENYIEAIKDFNYYLQLNPKDPNAMNSLGYTMLKIPNLMNKGLDLIKKSYKLDPTSESTNDSLGWAYYLQGKYKKALPYLKYAYQNLPNVETSMHLAAIYYELGNKNQALNLFKKAYKFDNENKELINLIKKYNIYIK